MNNANPWSKFFWNDWENDPALRLCSLTAQGLWMRLLCICAKADPVGYLMVEGHSPSHDDLALLIGRPAEELMPLLDELFERGVFSRDAKGRIYNRRLVRDAKALAEARKTGKLGGNPMLLKQRENPAGVNPQDKGADNTQKPESRVQKPESIPPVGPPAAGSPPRPKAETKPLAEDWELPGEWGSIAEKRGWCDSAIDRQAVKFKQYFGFGKGSGIRRSDKGWRQSWLNWLDRELKSHPDASTYGKGEETTIKPVSESRLSEDIRTRLRGHYAFNDTIIQRWFEACAFNLEKGIIEAPTAFHANYLENHYGDNINRALGRDMKIVVRKPKSTEGAA